MPTEDNFDYIDHMTDVLRRSREQLLESLQECRQSRLLLMKTLKEFNAFKQNALEFLQDAHPLRSQIEITIIRSEEVADL